MRPHPGCGRDDVGSQEQAPRSNPNLSSRIADLGTCHAGSRLLRLGSGLLYDFDQVTTARHSGPRLIEIRNEQFEAWRVETVAQSCHVFELIERMVDRGGAAAPEAPAFLGLELIHRQR